MKMQTTLGERLRAAREKKGLTQQQLADLMGCPQQQIHKIEVGTIKTPKGAFVTEVSRILEVPKAWLAFGDEAERISEEALRVARHYDALSAAAKKDILLIILEDKQQSLSEELSSTG